MPSCAFFPAEIGVINFDRAKIAIILAAIPYIDSTLGQDSNIAKEEKRL
jgi:hypothetical protein